MDFLAQTMGSDFSASEIGEDQLRFGCHSVIFLDFGREGGILKVDLSLRRSERPVSGCAVVREERH